MIYSIVFTFRLLFKYRAYSFVAIVGLALALATSWYIANYVHYFYKYDAFHEKAERIYRITMSFETGESTDHFAPTGTPVGEFLSNQFANIENFARLKFTDAPIAKIEDQQFKIHDCFVANQGIFDVFSFKFLSGNKATALDQPNSIILSGSLAKSYFGEDDALGRQLVINNLSYDVTGIFEDWPGNTHINVNALLSESNVKPDYDIQSWADLEQFNYVLVSEGVTKIDLQTNLAQLVEEHITPQLEGMGISIKYDAEPLKQVFFLPGLTDDIVKGNKHYVHALVIAGILIFVIATLNFLNLNLMQSARRAKEIALRKALGLTSRGLIQLKSLESVLITVLVIIVGIVLTFSVYPFYRSLVGIEIAVNWWNIFLFGLLITVIFLIGLAGAGSGPGFSLFSVTGFSKNNSSNKFFRMFLIGFQLLISMLIVMATLVVSQQVNFIKRKDLGYTSDQVMIINLPGDEALKSKADILKFEMLKYKGIKNVSIVGGGALPGEENGKEIFEIKVNGSKEERVYNIYRVDTDYFKLLDIKIANGRAFSVENATDTSEAIMINQVLATSLGWENPIGKTIWAWGKPRKVIGVVQNFHNKSLHNVIEPIVFVYDESYPSNILVKASTDQIDLVKTSWSKVYGENPMEIVFFKNQLSHLYEKENQLLSLLKYFSILSILLSCMGAIAVFALHIQQKTKEMSIRKVFGAGGLQIFNAITKRYLSITICAILLANISLWFLQQLWFSNFEYKVEINLLTLGFQGLLVLVVLFIAISYHLMRIMLVNPARTLREQ